MSGLEAPMHVTLNFDANGLSYGYVELTSHSEKIPNLHEYVMVPSFSKNDDGSYTIHEYSFVHRDHVATTEQLEKKYGKGNL